MEPDELWARIEPLLPIVPRRGDHLGRKRLDNRKVLSGIPFVRYTGIPWEFLPHTAGQQDWSKAVIEVSDRIQPPRGPRRRRRSRPSRPGGTRSAGMSSPHRATGRAGPE
ncbi:transposase [Nonomuraea sp. B19D2]|uniref:transposase n=1 Tax=Nonomuraea sp. B19D2 TaxID=3159561 RepID=UPI0032DB90F6